MSEQRTSKVFEGPGTSEIVAGKSVVASIVGPFEGTIWLEGRSSALAEIDSGMWAAVADLSNGGMHINSSPLNMEWRLNCPDFTTGKATCTLESSET